MLGAVAYMAAVVAAGYFARRISLLPESAYFKINDFVYYVSLPALIFAKLAVADLSSAPLLVAANALAIIIALAFTAALWKLRILSPGTCMLLASGFFFGNVVYMGFPLVQAAFGEEALATAAIVSAVYNVLMFTLGVFLMHAIVGDGKGKGLNEKLFKNTILISCVLGAAVSFLKISVPAPAISALGLLGSLTVPLALFSLGLFMHGKAFSKNIREAGLLCFFKMAVFPLLFFISAMVVGLSGQPYRVSLLEAVMPLAVTNFIIADKFGADKRAMAQAIVISTLIAFAALLIFGASV